KAIQAAELTFDQLENEERDLMRPPITGVEDRRERVAALLQEAGRDQLALEKVLLKSPFAAGATEWAAEEQRNQERDLQEIRTDLPALKASLDQIVAHLLRGEIEQADALHRAQVVPGFRHIQTGLDDL